ncbi:MAG: hypothetical protein AAF546_15190 [Verrucomicrobiota bacterium]
MPEDCEQHHTPFRTVKDQRPLEEARRLKYLPSLQIVMSPPETVDSNGDSPKRIPTPPPRPKSSRAAPKEIEESPAAPESKSIKPSSEDILANQEVDNLDVASLIIDSITAAAAIAFAVLLAQDMLPHL